GRGDAFGALAGFRPGVVGVERVRVRSVLTDTPAVLVSLEGGIEVDRRPKVVRELSRHVASRLSRSVPPRSLRGRIKPLCPARPARLRALRGTGPPTCAKSCRPRPWPGVSATGRAPPRPLPHSEGDPGVI